MCQQKKCPKCGEYSVYFDSYFKAYCCSRFSCTYFERAETEDPNPGAQPPIRETRPLMKPALLGR